MENLYCNPVKEKLKKREKVSVAWLQMCSPISAEIMAQCGFDILAIDAEHSPADAATMYHMMQAIYGYNVAPFVRAPWNDLVEIKRLLDVGIMGVHIPYVNTYEEALAAMRACKYPPLGNRGIAGSPRAAGYGANRGQYLQRANDEVMVMVAMETPEAVKNLDQILTIEGIDGIFIGPMDMATTSGYFGNPGHPEVQKIIMGIEEKVLTKSDKFLGTVAPSMDAAKALYERGYSYVVFAGDGSCMRANAVKAVADFNEYAGR